VEVRRGTGRLAGFVGGLGKGAGAGGVIRLFFVPGKAVKGVVWHVTW
jgi:hypothetical protein